MSTWAQKLAAAIALQQAAQHISIFVSDPDGGRLRLAAQVSGSGHDLDGVVVGEWIIPLEGSVCARVFRTGSAALCADVGLDPDYRSFPGGQSRSSLTVPVGAPGDVVAVINLESPWASAFSIRDYEELTARAEAALLTFPPRLV